MNPSAASPGGLSDLDFSTAGRWILGHQTFHIQLVAMLSVIDVCQAYLVSDDRPRLLASLEDLRGLFDASTANMTYTASFSPDLYTEAVRPSMMPPFLSPGFSGQLSHEHHLLMRDLKRLRLAIEARWGGKEARPADVVEGWRQIEKAIQRNRAHHGLVCQRFVPDGSSLLTDFMAARAREQGETE